MWALCLASASYYTHEAAGDKPSEKSGSPNVIVIMSDDMGYSDLAKFGKSEIPTPNIDRLANEGASFTNAYVTAPICVASRMGLLSGQNQQRFGVYDNIYGEERVRLFLQQTLLPAVFQKAGYRTGLVGKWYLNGNKKAQYETGAPPSADSMSSSAFAAETRPSGKAPRSIARASPSPSRHPNT